MPGKSDQLDALRAVPLLSGLSKAELQAFIREAKEEFFTPGSVVVNEGTTGGRFYVILHGRAKVIKGGRSKGTIGPGGFFGEMSIIDDAPRAATVKAESDLRALSIASWNFLSVLENNWSISHKVMMELCRRVRQSERSVTH